MLFQHSEESAFSDIASEVWHVTRDHFEVLTSMAIHLSLWLATSFESRARLGKLRHLLAMLLTVR